jgi:hypothetical protein
MSLLILNKRVEAAEELDKYQERFTNCLNNLNTILENFYQLGVSVVTDDDFLAQDKQDVQDRFDAAYRLLRNAVTGEGQAASIYPRLTIPNEFWVEAGFSCFSSSSSTSSSSTSST